MIDILAVESPKNMRPPPSTPQPAQASNPGQSAAPSLAMDDHPTTSSTTTPENTAETPDPDVPSPSTLNQKPPLNPAEWTTSLEEFSGIRNLGRTGYLSANLQLLFALKPFRNVCLLDDSCPDLYRLIYQQIIMNDLPPQRSPVIRTLREVFHALGRGRGTAPVCPLEFTKALGWQPCQLLDLKDALDVLESLLRNVVASGAVSGIELFALFNYHMTDAIGPSATWCK
jgi:hypothetical protein